MEEVRKKTPLLIGLAAAKANLLPGLIIQALMLVIVLGYYFHEPTRHLLNVLAGCKEKWGYGYSVVNAMVAGALIPEILKVIFFQRGRPNGENARELLFGIVFWGMMGAAVDTLYRAQGGWFGNDPTVSVLTRKVLVDQFLYNPLFAAPVTVWAYAWKNGGYRLDGIQRFFTPQFYGNQILPTLVATWGVWIPLVTLVYALPPLLQIPLFGLALSFWVLLVFYITRQKN